MPGIAPLVSWLIQFFETIFNFGCFTNSFDLGQMHNLDLLSSNFFLPAVMCKDTASGVRQDKALTCVENIKEPRPEFSFCKEALSSFFLEKSCDFLLVLDTNERIVFISQKGRDSLELGPLEPYLGRHWSCLWGDSNIAAIYAAIAAAKHNATGRFETYWPTARGNPRWWDATLHRVSATTGEAQLVVIARDVSAHKLAQKSLERSEARFRLAAESVNAIIFEWDACKDTIERTRGLEEILGYKAHEVPSSAGWWRELVHPEDRPSACSMPQDFPVGIRRYQMEYRVRHRDGHYVHVCDRLSLQWDGPRLIGAVGTTEDITARKLAEEALCKAKLAAEEANRAKTAFLASMSHEIRTPLGAILGLAALLAAPEVNPTDRQRFERVIKRSGKLLTRIIDDILDLSKVEAGRLELAPVEFKLPTLLDDVVGLLGISAAEKGLTLSVTSSRRIPNWITCDPLRLEQILVNIVGNAVKFTKQGSVALHVKALDGIEQGSPCMLEFLVTDTGPGMTPKQAQRLFEPFAQATAATTRHFGGSGLGLALSRRFARHMGGDVELLATTPGVGSTFRITIATSSAHGTAALGATSDGNTAALDAVGQTSACQRPLLSGMRILLVDDAPENLYVAERLLAQQGAFVVNATNGQECLMAAQEASFDVILMDIQMPVMDGFDAIRRLRARGDLTPIVALTAHALDDARNRSLAAGCIAHLTKPIDLDLMIETIQHAAARSLS